MPNTSLINPSDVAAPKPTYSHVAITPLSTTATKLITIAGQIGTGPSGSVPSDLRSQISNAYTNVENCLSAAGAKKTDIVKVTHYCVNYDPKDRTR